ncbi:MAG: NAD-dependent epimerase/dehydratase family protein [Myxococcota bacterium]
MRAFVTGGSGFVGRNLIRQLKDQGHDVAALTRSPKSAEAVRVLGAVPVEGDLDQQDAMARGMAGCDVVFHAAAHVEDWGRLEDFMRVNVGGTERVLAAARAAGVKRVVHVGTEAVLVDGTPLVRVDETRPRPRHPLGLYPLTKGLAEERVLAANGNGLETVVCRPRFIWGKGDTSLLPKFVEAVKRGQFRWFDGGHYLTSTCHVANVCEGLMAAAERGRPGEIYFLTDGEPVEFRGFMTAMLKTQGVDPGNGSIPRWLAYAAASTAEAVWRTFHLAGAPPVTRTAVLLVGEEVTVSDAKARREIGYVGRMTREEGLRQMEQP